MTALCGGGASGPKPGYNDVVYVGGAAIEALLTGLGMPEAAIVLGPLLAGASFELSTFCATDPPSDPGLTAADITDALNFNDVALSVPAIAKIAQWFGSRYWYDLCTCSTTTTPSPPALSNPGPISTNPGLPGATVGPCFVTHAAPAWAPSGANVTTDITASVLPATGTAISRSSAAGGISSTVLALPIPARHVRSDTTFPANTSGPVPGRYRTGRRCNVPVQCHGLRVESRSTSAHTQTGTSARPLHGTPWRA